MIAMGIVLGFALVMLAYRYQTTYKLLGKITPYLIGLILLITAYTAGAGSAAISLTGPAGAALDDIYTRQAGVIMAVMLLPFLLISVVTVLAAAFHGFVLVLAGPAEKRKRESSEPAYVKSYAPGYLVIGYTTAGNAYREDLYQRLGEKPKEADETLVIIDPNRLEGKAE